MEAQIFEELLGAFGVLVTVITRTPKTSSGTVVKTDKGKIVYDEEINEDVLCRVLDNTGNEVLWNNAMEQSNSATGLFRKTDIDLLNENSRIIYKGDVYYMKKPTERFTHYEVPLTKRDV